MATKKDQDKVFETWPVFVKIKGEGDAVTTHQVADCATFGIARYLAYAIAVRGVPTRWPKRENQQNKESSWLGSSAERAKRMGHVMAAEVVEEATFDRAIIAGAQMRSRARLANILGDVEGVHRAATVGRVRAALRVASMAIAEALLLPIVASDVTTVGVTWLPDAAETINGAAASWDVEAFAGELCGQCGHLHAGAVDLDMDAISAQLEEALRQVAPAPAA